MKRWIAHIDMDAFFAAIEQKDFPELVGQPVIIGADPHSRGVVSTASYEARAYGVRSGMPSRRAYDLCPHGIFRHSRFGRYEIVAHTIFEIMRHYSPALEVASIDEAYLDLSGTETLFGDICKTARRLKDEIANSTGLTASLGLAPNKLIAKIASDAQKPDGFVVVPHARVIDFLRQLNVSKLPGIGKKFTVALSEIGIYTIADVYKFEYETLVRMFGKSGEALFKMACGNDSSPIDIFHDRKGISVERTFQTDTNDLEKMRHLVLVISDKLAERLMRKRLCGRTLHIKIRFQDFSTITRTRSLPDYTRAYSEIFDAAWAIIPDLVSRKYVRLLGIGLSNLFPEKPRMYDLFFPDGPRDELLVSALIELKDKFGTDVLHRFSVSTKYK